MADNRILSVFLTFCIGSTSRIYNESIKDLLAPEERDLKIREDKRVFGFFKYKRGIFVSNLKEEVVSSAGQVLRVLQRGESTF